MNLYLALSSVLIWNGSKFYTVLKNYHAYWLTVCVPVNLILLIDKEKQIVQTLFFMQVKNRWYDDVLYINVYLCMPLVLSVEYTLHLTKILFKNKKGASEKIFYERRSYESVNIMSLFWVYTSYVYGDQYTGTLSVISLFELLCLPKKFS